ncbi:MAG: antitoxin VapB family protein [Methanothrix sp.]
MSTKTINITEEAYERLRSRKGENQSFSYSSSRISPQVKALPDPCLKAEITSSLTE